MMTRWVAGMMGLILALFTTACSAEDAAPDYRYRLTVEVDTPEGLKTGSSVIEVDQSLYRSAADPGAGLSLSRRVRGRLSRWTCRAVRRSMRCFGLKRH